MMTRRQTARRAVVRVALVATTLALVSCASDRPQTVSEPGATEAEMDPHSVEGLRLASAAVEREQAKLATRGPKPLHQPADRAEFFHAQRFTSPDQSVPFEHLRDVLDEITAREQAAGPSGQPVSWSELGPGNVGGRTRAFVIDPSDSSTFYAGGVTGGVWKSTDAGASWMPLDDLMMNLAISSLAIDPVNPNVLYAGTGEGVFGSSTTHRGHGIFKTVDAGATWTQLESTVTGVPQAAFHFVNKIRISPNDHNRLYAATRFGVWRSLDAGGSWQLVLANPTYADAASASNGCNVGCLDIAIREDVDPDVLFASFGSFQADGLFRSDDGGDTWLTYSVPPNQGRMTLAFAPSNNDVFYVLMADNGGGAPTGQLVNVYRSLDGGQTFEARVDFQSLTGPWLLSNLVLATGCFEGGTYSQGWYDNIIAVDPVDPDVVWVGGVDLFRSDDGGQSFGLAGYWFYYTLDPPPPSYIHPDHHLIVFHPDYDGESNQTAYFTNDGGIFRTDNARAATSQEDCPFPPDEPGPAIEWTSLNNGYGVTQFYHGDSAVEVDSFAGGTQDNGTNMVTSVGALNDWKLIFGGDGGYVAIDPEDNQRMFVEYQFFPTFQRSLDGGETFVEVIDGITDDDGLFITPFAMDQADPDVLWTGGSRPWRTTNGADLWEVAGPNFAGPGTISAVAIAPSDSNVVYLGFNNGYVVRTSNALDPSPTWSVFANGLYGAWVSSITVDPVDPDVAYLTYSTYFVPNVLQTTNGGVSWSTLEGTGDSVIPDIPAHWIAVRPCDSNQLFVGTELGVFASDDQGTTWTPVNEGLSHTIVESLDFKNANTLVAYTHGRGAFLGALEPCPGSCAEDLDGDGVVDGTDVGVLLGAWGSNDPAADLDGNGTVDGADLGLLLAAWGDCT